ncbi:MAG: NAD(P)-binding protein, partial [Planctomycetota bacterium]
MTEKRVAIIGAGMAGLTLADRLGEAGVACVVFDKGRRVAGRMSTRTTHDGHAFDHGAQYFTAKNPRFAEAVERWVADGIAAPWRGRIGTLRRGSFDPSQKTTVRYVGVPGNGALCDRLAGGVDVRSGVTVATPTRQGDRWLLTSDAGADLGGFDWVVSSAPAPQSKTLLAASRRLSEQAAATPVTGCWAGMFAFEAPIETPFDGAFVDESPLSWIARDSSKPGRPTDADRWVVHGSPEWSEEHMELDPVEATDRLLAAFCEALQTTPREPLYARAHRWRYALPSEPLEEPFLVDVGGKLAACGDWCGGPRVEGAYLSGLSLAERLISE